MATEKIASNSQDEPQVDNNSHVKGYNVKYFKLQYQVWCGGKWSKSKTQKDTKFDSKKCENGKTYRIDISNTGC